MKIANMSSKHLLKRLDCHFTSFFHQSSHLRYAIRELEQDAIHNRQLNDR